MDHERRIDTAQDLDLALLRFFQTHHRSAPPQQADDGETLLAAAEDLSLGEGEYELQRIEALDCVREIIAQARRGASADDGAAAQPASAEPGASEHR
jgi:hypothetical protein